MFLVALVCLFVCGHYSKSYERIGMKFLWRGPRKYKEELITFWWWSVYSQII